MKPSYTQLTKEERYHLYTMRKQHLSLRDIAKGMGRSYTTLSREVARNTGQKAIAINKPIRRRASDTRTSPKR